MHKMVQVTALSLIVVCISAYAVGAVAQESGAGSASAPGGQESGTQSVSATAGTLSGKWTGSLTDPGGGQHPVTLNLKVEGSVVTGTLVGGPPDGAARPLSNGKIAGDHISFQVNASGSPSEPFVLNFDGIVAGDRIEGVHGPQGESFPWEVTKR